MYIFCSAMSILIHVDMSSLNPCFLAGSGSPSFARIESVNRVISFVFCDVNSATMSSILSIWGCQLWYKSVLHKWLKGWGRKSGAYNILLCFPRSLRLCTLELILSIIGKSQLTDLSGQDTYFASRWWCTPLTQYTKLTLNLIFWVNLEWQNFNRQYLHFL